MRYDTRQDDLRAMSQLLEDGRIDENEARELKRYIESLAKAA